MQASPLQPFDRRHSEASAHVDESRVGVQAADVLFGGHDGFQLSSWPTLEQESYLLFQSRHSLIKVSHNLLPSRST